MRGKRLEQPAQLAEASPLTHTGAEADVETTLQRHLLARLETTEESLRLLLAMQRADLAPRKRVLFDCFGCTTAVTACVFVFVRGGGQTPAEAIVCVSFRLHHHPTGSRPVLEAGRVLGKPSSRSPCFRFPVRHRR